jgi:hypothetical protein
VTQPAGVTEKSPRWRIRRRGGPGWKVWMRVQLPSLGWVYAPMGTWRTHAAACDYVRRTDANNFAAGESA